MNESPSEVAWAHWLGNVEFDIGHNLDGDDECDGFSLESAQALFEADFSVEEAIAEIEISKDAVNPPVHPNGEHIFLED